MYLLSFHTIHILIVNELRAKRLQPTRPRKEQTNNQGYQQRRKITLKKETPATGIGNRNTKKDRMLSSISRN